MILARAESKAPRFIFLLCIVGSARGKAPRHHVTKRVRSTLRISRGDDAQQGRAEAKNWIMDTVSREYRLEKSGAGAGGFTWGEWSINDRHALMMHRPTRAVFLIYLAADADPVLPSIYQLRACLSHVCDGQPVPDGLAILGEHAVNAYACWTERLEFIEWQSRPGDEIPF